VNLFHHVAILIRQRRNTATHAAFYLDDTSHQIERIEFIAMSRAEGQGFHIILPIKRLNTFLIKLAKSALDRLLKQ